MLWEGNNWTVLFFWKHIFDLPFSHPVSFLRIAYVEKKQSVVIATKRKKTESHSGSWCHPVKSSREVSVKSAVHLVGCHPSTTGFLAIDVGFSLEVERFQMASFGITAIPFLLLITSFQSVGALSCYQCGTGSDKGDDACETLPRIANYIVECQAEDYCSKMTSKIWSGDDGVERMTRGCAAPVTINGKLHQLGCHVDQRTGGVICYCNFNLCNRASITSSPAPLTLVVGLFILTNYRMCW